MEIMYTKFNTTRKPKYQISTTIYKENETPYVKKKALNKSAIPHIQNLISNTDPLCEIIHTETDSVTFAYIEGKTFSDLLLDACEKCDKDKFIDLVNDYKKFIFKREIIDKEIFNPTEEFVEMFGYPTEVLKNIQCFKKSNIDLNFDNIIIDADGNYIILDSEWVFDFEIPVKFVLFRAMESLFIRNEFILSKFISADELLSLLGVNDKELSLSRIFELNFAENVYGKNSGDFRYEKETIKIDLERDMIPVKGMNKLQIYFSENGQYSESNSLVTHFEYSKELRTFEFTLPLGFRGGIRIDPSETNSLMIVKNITIYKQIENVDRELLKLFSSDTDFSGIVLANGLKAFNDGNFLHMISENNDSNFILDFFIESLKDELITISINMSAQPIQEKDLIEFVSGYTNKSELLYQQLQDKYNNSESQLSILNDTINMKAILDKKMQELETVMQKNIILANDIDKIISLNGNLNSGITILDESLKNAQILNESLELFDKLIDMNNEINMLKNNLSMFESENDILRNNLSVLENKNTNLNQELLAIENDNSILKNTLDSVFSSTTWKMTKPIRVIINMFRAG